MIHGDKICRHLKYVEGVSRDMIQYDPEISDPEDKQRYAFTVALLCLV